MAKINTEFLDDSINFYSKTESDLEDKIENAIQEIGKGSDIIDSADSEIYEHLSPLREALLKWYEFSHNCTVLEVGGVFGALTSILCRKASFVTCLENKQRRCQIIKERYKDQKNLEVVCGSIFSAELTQKYDYVVIHDFWGYVKKFVKSQSPYVAFLEKVKTYLKENGTILLACENRIGLKYFAGCVEDYSYKFFTGLNNFDGYDGIQTFTKKELQELFYAAGLPDYRFYYPFPDYIFPLEIYTDEYLNSDYYGGEIKCADWDRFRFFNERSLYQTLQREGLITHFVNAFLVEIGNTGLNKDTLYYKTNIDKSMQTAGMLIKKERKKGLICKPAAGTVSEAYIESRIPENSKNMNMHLSDYLKAALTCNEKENIYVEKIFAIFQKITENILLKAYTHSYIASPEFEEIFGELPQKFKNDTFRYSNEIQPSITTDHIFVSGDKFYFAEVQKVNMPVPVDYVIWNLIYSWFLTFVNPYKSIKKRIHLKRLFLNCQIEESKIELFNYWKKNYELKMRSALVHKYAHAYDADFIYPVDVVLNGDLVMSGLSEQASLNSSLQNALIENEILSLLRR